MAELIEIATGEGTAEAYLAQGGSKGGVLFFMDAFGLRPRIAEMVDRIASWGYTVLAPNVFYRDGSAAELAPTGDLHVPEERSRFFTTSGVRQRMARLTPERAAIDTAAYVETLRQYVGAETRLGTTGYCMGARLAMRAAGQFPGVIVAVGGFHGGNLVTDDPQSPHTTVTARAEYVFGHADNDASMTRADVAALGQALDAVGATYVNEIYAGAPHGYTMSDTSVWREEAAERHFAALQALLARTLG